MAKQGFKFTKLKLITGYIILVILGGFAITFIYDKVFTLVEKDPQETITQKKLYTITNTLAKLYEAESVGMSFSQNNSQREFNKYMQSIKEINENIDTLKHLSSDTAQILRLDSINLLLNRRIQNLRELVNLKRDSIPEDFYEKALETIESLKDTIDTEQNIYSRKRIIQDTIYTQPEERRGFWSRVFGPQPKITKDSVPFNIKITEEFITDTLNVTTTTTTDTLKSVLRDALDEYRQQKEEIDRQVYNKEIAIIKTGQIITEQIKRILSDIESEEYDITVARLEKQNELTHELTQTMGWIAIVACVLILFFLFLIFSDISKSQRYRRELEDANAYTEKLLADRERLMLAVTHDIKSPLGSIINYIDLLDQSDLDPEQHNCLNNMRSSAQHILNLARNMLDFTKLESNKVEIIEQTFIPKKVITEIVDSFRPQAIKEHLELKVDISEALSASYSGDDLKIRQIIVNLVSNAIKYTREGFVEVKASLSPLKGRYLVVSIEDSGPGMTEEEQEVIFKEFTRLSKEHNKGSEGTGLGLTITKQLLELLDGKLQLESTKGKGSKFTVKIPIKKVEATSNSQRTHHTLTDLRMLIIDDDELILKNCADIFSRLSIEYHTCNNPENAIKTIFDKNINILITDIQMPQMDGFDLIEAIRKTEGLKEIPVIARSGRDDIHEKDYQKAGFTAFVSKSSTTKELLECITEITGYKLQFPQKEPSLKLNTTGYNLNNILPFTGDDPEAIREIISMFVTDCEQNFETLNTYYDEAKLDDINKLAHKMLPMYRQFNIEKTIIDKLIFLERNYLLKFDTNLIKETIEQIITQSRQIINNMKKENNLI